VRDGNSYPIVASPLLTIFIFSFGKVMMRGVAKDKYLRSLTAVPKIRMTADNQPSGINVQVTGTWHPSFTHPLYLFVRDG
jgi:hypothetical protein